MIKLKLYTSHCPKCIVIKNILDDKKIEYEVIDEENVYLPLAQENGILSMPFAEVDGKLIGDNKLQQWINDN